MSFWSFPMRENIDVAVFFLEIEIFTSNWEDVYIKIYKIAFIWNKLVFKIERTS